MQNANGFVLSVIIVKNFGLAAAGSLTIASIGTTVLATMCAFGLPFVFARLGTEARAQNSVGLLCSVAGVVVAVPPCLGLGLLFGKDPAEAAVVFLLSLGGAYFAVTSIASALLLVQNRGADVILSPLGNSIGLALGGLLADDLLTFAIILTVARFAGAFAAFARSRFGPASFATIVAHLRCGVDYLSVDTLNLGSYQASVMLTSVLLSREELGIFGLCRQIITVSDTPASSSTSVWYPRLCQHPQQSFPGFKRHMLQLGAYCALGLAVLSVPLGLWIYHSPVFALLAPLMVASVPFRYLVVAREALIRAIGQIRAMRELTIFRCALCVLLPLGVLAGGVLGAIITSVLQSIISFWFIRTLMSRHKLGYEHLDSDQRLSPARCPGPLRRGRSK